MAPSLLSSLKKLRRTSQSLLYGPGLQIGPGFCGRVGENGRRVRFRAPERLGVGSNAVKEEPVLQALMRDVRPERRPKSFPLRGGRTTAEAARSPERLARLASNPRRPAQGGGPPGRPGPPAARGYTQKQNVPAPRRLHGSPCRGNRVHGEQPRRGRRSDHSLEEMHAYNGIRIRTVVAPGSPQSSSMDPLMASVSILALYAPSPVPFFLPYVTYFSKR